MQRYIGTAPRIGGWGEVIGIGFTGDLEDREGHGFWYCRPACKPFCIGPTLNHSLSICITFFG